MQLEVKGSWEEKDFTFFFKYPFYRSKNSFKVIRLRSKSGSLLSNCYLLRYTGFENWTFQLCIHGILIYFPYSIFIFFPHWSLDDRSNTYTRWVTLSLNLASYNGLAEQSSHWFMCLYLEEWAVNIWSRSVFMFAQESNPFPKGRYFFFVWRTRDMWIHNIVEGCYQAVGLIVYYLTISRFLFLQPNRPARKLHKSKLPILLPTLSWLHLDNYRNTRPLCLSVLWKFSLRG